MRGANIQHTDPSGKYLNIVEDVSVQIKWTPGPPLTHFPGRGKVETDVSIWWAQSYTSSHLMGLYGVALGWSTFWAVLQGYTRGFDVWRIYTLVWISDTPDAVKGEGENVFFRMLCVCILMGWVFLLQALKSVSYPQQMGLDVVRGNQTIKRVSYPLWSPFKPFILYFCTNLFFPVWNNSTANCNYFYCIACGEWLLRVDIVWVCKWGGFAFGTIRILLIPVLL